MQVCKVYVIETWLSKEKDGQKARQKNKWMNNEL